MVEYAVRTDEANKAVVLNLKPTKVGRNPQHGAHMRAFWASTISFFLAFMGWFALSPIAIDVVESIGACENQLYPPRLHPSRKAYVHYRKADFPELPYCTYGQDRAEDPTDCIDSPDPATKQAANYSKYNYDLLPSCVCTPGTRCSNTIIHSSIGSVAVALVPRLALGTLLERFGPVNVQCGLMLVGALWAFASTGILSEWSFILVRAMAGSVGAAFVSTQYWCSLMFAPSILGTANATAAGWGNLGGGVVQVFVVWVLFRPLQEVMSKDQAWRVAMVVPGVFFLVAAVVMKLTCWDAPTARRYSKKNAFLSDYIDCLLNRNVLVMIIQYSACFGAELTMNAQLTTHFRTYFQMDSAVAAALASTFGLMNIFARSLGGIASDVCFHYFGFNGRLWAQFFCLQFEAISLMGFGLVQSSEDWRVVIALLVCFSLFVQMAEGTSYAIVPFMIPEHVGCVSALVAAGGNFGAVLALWGFYLPIGSTDTLQPFRVHALYVNISSVLTAVYYWPETGGVFTDPVKEYAKKVWRKTDEEVEEKKEEENNATPV